MRRYSFLAFDCGATSGRGILAHIGPDTFSMEEVYRFPSEVKEKNGHLYWDIHAMYSHLVECLKLLGAKGVKLDSIGIDTWGVDFGCIGQDGELLGLPRCYRDTYTVGIPEKVFRVVPREELYRRTGIQIMNLNTIFQLYAQTEDGDKHLGLSSSILFMPDLLSYLLTGRQVCEYTEASTSGMMNPFTKSFDKGLLKKLGIRSDYLLQLVLPGVQIGCLKPEIAENTGLGPVPVIAVAGHDTASAIAAVPATGSNFAYLSSGTWSLMGVELPEPVITEESAKDNFTNEGGIEGTTCFLKNITGMWLLEQCRKVWKKEGKDYSYQQLDEMAIAEAGFPGRINPDDPRFASPSDMTVDIKTALGMEATDAQIVSCIYHSLADCYAEVLNALRRFATFDIEKLHIIGGGSANSVLNQWTAESTGITIVAGPTEATAIGNIMIQAKAKGLVSDRWEMRKMIAKLFELKVYKPNE